jgi:transcription-repair coupling factor (superfamily II helicase)
LYYKLLHLAVKEVKGEKENEVREVKLDIAIDAFVPESYINAEDERIKLISEISDITSSNNIESIRNNLIGLYGKPPKEVENLLLLGLVKHKAQQNGVRRIVLNSRQFVVYFYDKKEKILEAGDIKEGLEILCQEDWL